MTAEEALLILKNASEQRRLFLSDHARQRMESRDILMIDIKNCINKAHQCAASGSAEEMTWVVLGPDRFDDDIRIIFSIEYIPGSNERAVIITVTDA